MSSGNNKVCSRGLDVLFSLTLPGIPLGVCRSNSIGSRLHRSVSLLVVSDESCRLSLRGLHPEVTPACSVFLVSQVGSGALFFVVAVVASSPVPVPQPGSDRTSVRIPTMNPSLLVYNKCSLFYYFYPTMLCMF